jgi:hypothetical protein
MPSIADSPPPLPTAARSGALGYQHAPPALALAANPIPLNLDLQMSFDRESAPTVEQSIGAVR